MPGFGFAERELIASDANLQGVTERREPDDFQLFPLGNSHFHQTLGDGRGSGDLGNDATLAGLQLIEGRHSVSCGVGSLRIESDQDIDHAVGTQGQLGLINAKEEGVSGHDRLQSAATPESLFCQPVDETLIAEDVDNFPFLAGSEHFEGNDLAHDTLYLKLSFNLGTTIAS